jgi:hypothetical protein
MAYKDGTKSGGKKKGSKNKSTLARLAAIEEASKKIASTDGSGVFPGDAQALLAVIYKTESFPLDVRMRAAEMANTRERPALQSVDSNIKDQRTYVVEMPAPVKDLDEWKRLHAAPAPDSEADAEWNQRLARIVDSAKDQPQ